jgi:hypothetical protein
MKKNIGIIIVIILILFSFIFSFIIVPYVNNKSVFVIIGDNTIWKKTNDSWKSVSVRSLPKFSYSKVYSYNGSNYIGETYNDYSDDLIVYDKNYEQIELTSELLSIKTSEKLKSTKSVYNSDEEEWDSEYINKVLEKYSITEEYEVNKYVIDVNNDGNQDTIFNISNFYLNDEDETSYSIIFSVINDNIDIIDSVIVSKDEELKTQTINLNHVVDLDNDGEYEIIITKASYGNSDDVCNTMYKYDISSNKYIKIIGC